MKQIVWKLKRSKYLPFLRYMKKVIFSTGAILNDLRGELRGRLKMLVPTMSRERLIKGSVKRSTQAMKTFVFNLMILIITGKTK